MAGVFIRIEAYGGERVNAVIGETCREPEFSTHVEQPQPVDRELGKALRQAVSEYLAKPETYIDDKGKLIKRRRRRDARCLVAGVASYPTPISRLHGDADALNDAVAWRKETVAFLKKEFPDQRIFFKTHIDEGFLHIHFLMIGDANRIHPGLRAELDEFGKRRAGKRKEAYKSGVKSFVDRYYEAVGQSRNWIRKGQRPVWRIKDRALRAKAVEIEKEMRILRAQAAKVPEMRQKLDTLAVAFGNLLDSAKLQHWPRPPTNSGFRIGTKAGQSH